MKDDDRQQAVDAKIVAALERISQVFRILLWERAKETNLSPIQIQILIFLRDHAGKDMRRTGGVAREFDLTPATISDALTSLESKGFIRRERIDEDRRGVGILLTPAGAQLAETIDNWTDPAREHISNMDADDRERAFLFLSSLIFSLQKSGIISIVRMCANCVFFAPGGPSLADGPHYCTLLKQPLTIQELRIDCPDHILAENRTDPE